MQAHKSGIVFDMLETVDRDWILMEYLNTLVQCSGVHAVDFRQVFVSSQTVINLIVVTVQEFSSQIKLRVS